MPDGYLIVNPTQAPESSPFYSVVQTIPVENDGVWSEVWSQTPVALALAQQMAIANLAQARYQAQTAPVTVDDVTINATSDSMTLLNSAISSLGGSSTATINFKAVSGWVQLNLAQLQALSAAVNTQIQSCFTNEFNLTQQIMALTDTPSVAAFDINTGW